MILRSVALRRLLAVGLLFGMIVTVAATQSPAPAPAQTPAPAAPAQAAHSVPAPTALRPAVMGRSAAVSTGHPLTSAAAFTTLVKGGNAFDAGVAAMLAGGVVEQDLYSLGGEGLVLVYPQKERKVTAVVGQGWAPAAVNVDWYLSRQKTLAGAGLDPAVVPGAVHAALTVLERWGTMSVAEVTASAIGYADGGFPQRESTARTIHQQLPFFEKWPGNKQYWLKPDG